MQSWSAFADLLMYFYVLICHLCYSSFLMPNLKFKHTQICRRIASGTEADNAEVRVLPLLLRVACLACWLSLGGLWFGRAMIWALGGRAMTEASIRLRPAADSVPASCLGLGWQPFVGRSSVEAALQ